MGSGPKSKEDGKVTPQEEKDDLHLGYNCGENSVVFDDNPQTEEVSECCLLRTQSSLAPPIEASAITDVEEAWRALSKELEENIVKPSIKTLGTVFVTREEVGKKDSVDYRIYFKNEEGRRISPWHDVPLWFSETPLLYNMIVEIPKLTNKKFEMSTKEEYTPLLQDRKLEKLRSYPGPIPWNYGAFPQTWEDPNKKGDEFVDFCHGDNDPLDAVEIGAGALPRGGVIPVKTLGCLALIDDDELDWKIVCIRVCDPHASKLNDIDDVETYFPGTIDRIRKWFGLYKAIENNDVEKVNMYGHFGEPQPASYAHKVINETHHSYLKLIQDECRNHSLWVPPTRSNNETPLTHSTASTSINDIGTVTAND
ncbi:hypothetical protein FG379_003605 [Cryptosporidium bovis]|uniref:uncharacterized protein n=1 Tax=Cryptosporidium bovis TaxID=310047 RepID=UPI00351AACB2|nr:hypothetical protein FG379_003605 [Cryptosporidium bovis]